ncbi:hypothetical protein ABMY26_22350 [Azospirillum sp. HJ39]|uniref:hypothetical protein n=1 Tax=Azospirillum sp. HJ39 TaxID=3159496 RepID=UPI0035580B45
MAMLLDAANPMQDAFETIRATDVISDDKKHVLYRELEAWRRQHCQADSQCEECRTRRRCLTAVFDLLGS